MKSSKNLPSILLLIVIFLLLPSYKEYEISAKSEPAKMLIRCDDIGMCHSVNVAMEELIEAGFPFSASVMFVCPWYQEAIEILREHPEISVGVHLTLNSEWKNYRWGPVLGKEAVPSLVDSVGYFFPSSDAFFNNDPEVDEVEKELRAQLERAVKSGLRIDYLDTHMSTISETREYQDIVVKLAEEYKLGISGAFRENYNNKIYSVPVETKIDTLIHYIEKIEPENLNLFVFHIGKDNPEMRALEDMNPSGLENMSKHRDAELNALKSKKFIDTIKENGIELITYRVVIERVGLENMEASKID